MTTPTHLYQQFALEKDFKDLLHFCQRMQCVLWFHEGKRWMVVTAQGHDMIKSYYKTRKGVQNDAQSLS